MKDQSEGTNIGRGFDIPDPATLPSLKNQVSPEEWDLRVQLAATYRL